MHICIYIYIFIYVRTYIYIYIYMCLSKNMYVHIYVHMYIRLRIHIGEEVTRGHLVPPPGGGGPGLRLSVDCLRPPLREARFLGLSWRPSVLKACGSVLSLRTFERPFTW